MNSNRTHDLVIRSQIGKFAGKPLKLLLAILAAGSLLLAGPTRANNLLVNPSFEANSGHSVATGWTYFSPPAPPNYFGDYWVENNVPAHDGTLYWKQWGALYLPAPTNNVAGIFQEFSSAPGSGYQASGWFYTSSSGNELLGADCRLWLEVLFLNGSGQTLALYKSEDFTASIGSDAWYQYQVTQACDLGSPVASGDPYFTTYAVTGTVSQVVSPPGTAKVRYRLAYLQAGQEGGSAYLDDAVLDQVSGPIPPVISSVFPLNMIFVNPPDGIKFNVNSPSGFTINNSGIGLTVNGVDVSANLTISGSASNKNVSYFGLQSNQTYTVSMTVTDSFGFSATANTYFETTWVGLEPVNYLWEAEDFDFNSGQYLNNPDLCNAGGNPNCYFGKVGVEGVDEHNLNGGGSHLYCPTDPMGTGVSGDFLRKNLWDAGRLDYKIDPFNFSEWVNYTRDWPASTNWIIARLATDVGLTGTLTLSKVNPDTTTTDLGTFTIASGRGWSAFDNVYLKDTNGFLASVALNGKETLRLTSGGNLLPNCFMLVTAQVDLPQLSNLYPTGTHPFEPTNALSFTVSTVGATFPASGIKMVLDGSDVSANLVVTGSASAKSVVYPGLLPNAKHTAIITVTNSLNHGISLTNEFDTFSQDNYMVETEDFDYGGGQFVADWYPESYLGLPPTTNIDFQHTPVSPADEQFIYRSDGIPEDLTHDYLRDEFISVGAFDYDLTWFGTGDWANYRRAFPAGNYYVYGRIAGLGDYSLYLDQVIQGAGTANQVTIRLGRWGTVGRSYSTYDWVPLTDDGLVAPVVIKLNGLATLRITTTGNNNPNYFMFVPVSGIALTAGSSSGSNVVSFPTQTGVIYRVLYRESLTEGTWMLLTSVVGDGAVKSVTDPSTAARRFYQVVAP